MNQIKSRITKGKSKDWGGAKTHSVTPIRGRTQCDACAQNEGRSNRTRRGCTGNARIERIERNRVHTHSKKGNLSDVTVTSL